MKKRFIITIRFTVDKDMVEGFGNTAKSWIDFIVQEFSIQKHYNASYEVVEVKEEIKE